MTQGKGGGREKRKTERKQRTCIHPSTAKLTAINEKRILTHKICRRGCNCIDYRGNY